jgi:hypothetical protein
MGSGDKWGCEQDEKFMLQHMRTEQSITEAMQW